MPSISPVQTIRQTLTAELEKLADLHNWLGCFDEEIAAIKIALAFTEKLNIAEEVTPDYPEIWDDPDFVNHSLNGFVVS